MVLRRVPKFSPVPTLRWVTVSRRCFETSININPATRRHTQKTRIPSSTTVDIIFFVAFRRVRVVAQRAHSLHHVCPSVRMYEHESHWMDFHAILYWKLLLKSVKKIQIWLKSDNNTKHFILSPKYILHCWERHVLFSNTKDEPQLPFDGNNSNIIQC